MITTNKKTLMRSGPKIRGAYKRSLQFIWNQFPVKFENIILTGVCADLYWERANDVKCSEML